MLLVGSAGASPTQPCTHPPTPKAWSQSSRVAAGARRVCVVYGALPPEMRNNQARLFNEPGNGFDIMVASDAVGMGLNLNIRRIVFHTVLKLDGPHTFAPVPVPHIKQIAGEAPL